MSLVDISRAPTADSAAIHLHPADNVAIARVALAPGQPVRVGGLDGKATAAIPAGHKIALREIAAGEPLLRYGQLMGRARIDIAPGDYVHVHNVAYEELAQQYEFPVGETPLPAFPANGPTFQGYARDDGRAGTRNYIAIVAASNCAAHTAELIAQSFAGQALPDSVDGVVAFPHGEGCGMSPGPDLAQLQRTLYGVLDHPNVSSAIILGLGCEVNQIDHYLGAAKRRDNDRLVGMTLQQSGGTAATVEAARREIARLIERAASERRTAISASKIVLGLNCGGSDAFSGITANPALGACCDKLSALAATAVLAETTETFGAEHLLVRRARNREVGEKMLAIMDWYRRYLRQFAGGTFDDNPTPGNKAGGLTNILEKSLGAMTKAGTSPLNDVVGYAERISTPGFVFMNTPGYDPVSLTGLAAGGCNLIAFTTGRGSAIGFPTVPVIKIATNTSTYRRMQDNMEVNAGRIADGDATVAQIGDEIFGHVLRAASGERTRAEILGHREFAPWRIGPVM